MNRAALLKAITSSAVAEAFLAERTLRWRPQSIQIRVAVEYIEQVRAGGGVAVQTKARHAF